MSNEVKINRHFSRIDQAKKILSIIQDYSSNSIGAYQSLEIGCASGEISLFLSNYVESIIGLEIDSKALYNSETRTLRNYQLIQGDGSKLPFDSERFDLIILAQVYEHTQNQIQLADEIFRVLKPGGICFFSGPNRWQLIEPHYFLPFLSWLPNNFSNIYLKILRRGDNFDIYPLGYKNLKKLWKKFSIIDYTSKLITSPEIFDGMNRLGKNKIIKLIPKRILDFLIPIYPNYNWILQKEFDVIETPAQHIYDEYYFKHACGGHEEFLKTQGQELSPWMNYVLKLSELKSEERVLDLGTGRGEIAMHAANEGCFTIGLDYSIASMKLAITLREKTRKTKKQLNLILSDARYLPFKNNYFDVIFMLDIVEHLSSKDLINVLRQVFETLSPEGRLIVHTMPNMNYYKWAYPIYRIIMRIIGKSLPKDPRKRFYHGECHVNIQTPKLLRNSLESVGFLNIRIILTQLSGSKFKKILCRTFPLKYILANDIIAIAIK